MPRSSVQHATAAPDATEPAAHSTAALLVHHALRQADQTGTLPDDASDLRQLRALAASPALVLEIDEQTKSSTVNHAMRVFNTLLERGSGCTYHRLHAHDETAPLLLKAICLFVYQRLGARDIDDAERAELARHWIKTGAKLLALDEAEEAFFCLGRARLALDTASLEHADVLNVSCYHRGWEASAEWVRKAPERAVHLLEEALDFANFRAGTLCTDSTRFFLAVDVAFALACQGHIGGTSLRLVETDAATTGSAPMEVIPSDADSKDARMRRSVMRLAEIAELLLSFTGSGATPDAPPSLTEWIAARDRVLRLLAWLCMQEDKMESAADWLTKHSAVCDGGVSKDDEESLVQLQLALLFLTDRVTEAAARASGWLLSDEGASLRVDTVLNTLGLLCEHGCAEAATRACDHFLNHPGGGDGEARALHSELCELQYKLLTEMVPDSAAATALLDLILDGHATSAKPVRRETLSWLAKRLWNRGYEAFNDGELYKTIEYYEQCARFLRAAADNESLCSTNASLAHCHWLQGSYGKAIGCAKEALALGQAPTSSEVPLGIDAVAPAHPTLLAHSVLIKSQLRVGDQDDAQASVDAFFRAHPSDRLLIATLCEDVIAMGTSHRATAIKLLEGHLRALDSEMAGADERVHLASTVRSLMMMRSDDGAAAARNDDERGATATYDGKCDQTRIMVSQLGDARLLCKRIAQAGAEAVCDDADHLEWIGGKAWSLALELVESFTESETVSQVELELAVGLFECFCELSAALPSSEERLKAQLLAQLVLCRLRLSLVSPGATEVPTEKREAHAKSASTAIQAAFRLRERCRGVEVRSGAQTSGKTSSLDVALVLHNIEVGLLCKDPNLGANLHRAAESESISPQHLLEISCSARKVSDRKAQLLALELAMAKLLASDLKNMNLLATLLRARISACTSRVDKWVHYERLSQELQPFSADNCPLDEDSLQWFLATAHNIGVKAFMDEAFADAERWFSLATSFVNLAPRAFEGTRKAMAMAYDEVLKKLSGPGCTPQPALLARLSALFAQVAPIPPEGK